MRSTASIKSRNLPPTCGRSPPARSCRRCRETSRFIDRTAKLIAPEMHQPFQQRSIASTAAPARTRIIDIIGRRYCGKRTRLLCHRGRHHRLRRCRLIGAPGARGAAPESVRRRARSRGAPASPRRRAMERRRAAAIATSRADPIRYSKIARTGPSPKRLGGDGVAACLKAHEALASVKIRSCPTARNGWQVDLCRSALPAVYAQRTL